MPTDNQLPDSDLPHVRGLYAAERSNPVVEVNIGKWTDKSGTLGEAGVSQVVFEAVTDLSVISRNIQNINEAGNLWVNYYGADAAVGEPGSYLLVPGALLTIPSRGVVSVCGDLPDLKFTAGEA